METRTKDLSGEFKNAGRQVQETITETADDLVNKTRRAREAAMESAKAAYQLAQTKVVAGAKATDQAIRGNPYASLGIAFGAGLLLGFLIRRKSNENN